MVLLVLGQKVALYIIATTTTDIGIGAILALSLQDLLNAHAVQNS